MSSRFRALVLASGSRTRGRRWHPTAPGRAPSSLPAQERSAGRGPAAPDRGWRVARRRSSGWCGPRSGVERQPALSTAGADNTGRRRRIVKASRGVPPAGQTAPEQEECVRGDKIRFHAQEVRNIPARVPNNRSASAPISTASAKHAPRRPVPAADGMETVSAGGAGGHAAGLAPRPPGSNPRANAPARARQGPARARSPAVRRPAAGPGGGRRRCDRAGRMRGGRWGPHRALPSGRCGSA